MTITNPARTRLLRWRWIYAYSQREHKALEVYMPGPDGDRKNGILLLVAKSSKFRENKPSVKDYRGRLERSFGMEILRRYAGVSSD